MNPLDNIRVVLVEPATPGNIGATARVLKTTGISQLALVNPGAWDTPEARTFAHGAGDILDGSQVFPSLAAAVADCHIVVGTTHRQGRFRTVTSAPEPLIAQLATQVHDRRIALVFGRERDGLWHEELALCHQVLRFPTAVAYPSLNLSHAVLLLTYGLYAAVDEKPPDPPVQLATADERERMLAQILQALAEIEFTPYNNKLGSLRPSAAPLLQQGRFGSPRCAGDSDYMRPDPQVQPPLSPQWRAVRPQSWGRLMDYLL